MMTSSTPRSDVMDGRIVPTKGSIQHHRREGDDVDVVVADDDAAAAASAMRRTILDEFRSLDSWRRRGGHLQGGEGSSRAGYGREDSEAARDVQVVVR